MQDSVTYLIVGYDCCDISCWQYAAHLWEVLAIIEVHFEVTGQASTLACL